jgi:hypothetical protein
VHDLKVTIRFCSSIAFRRKYSSRSVIKSIVSIHTPRQTSSNRIVDNQRIFHFLILDSLILQNRFVFSCLTGPIGIYVFMAEFYSQDCRLSGVRRWKTSAQIQQSINLSIYPIRRRQPSMLNC